MINSNLLNDLKEMTTEKFSRDENSLDYQIIQVVLDEKFIQEHPYFTNKQVAEEVVHRYDRKIVSVIAHCKLLSTGVWDRILNHEKKVLSGCHVPQWVHTYSEEFLKVLHTQEIPETEPIEIPEIPEITEVPEVPEVHVEEPIVENNLISSLQILDQVEEKKESKLKVVLLGGFPQEFPRFNKIADQYNIDLKIFTKNILNLGTPDLLILCTARTSHAYQWVLNKYKTLTDVRYMNTCHSRGFESLIKEYLTEKNLITDIPEINTQESDQADQPDEEIVETVIAPLEETPCMKTIPQILAECKSSIEDSLLMAYQALDALGIDPECLNVNGTNDLVLSLNITH